MDYRPDAFPKGEASSSKKLAVFPRKHFHISPKTRRRTRFKAKTLFLDTGMRRTSPSPINPALWSIFFPDDKIVGYSCRENLSNMNIKHLLTLFLAYMAVACSDDTPYINVNNTGSTSIIISSERDATGTLSFSTNQAWTATDDADWLSLSPVSGGTGDQAITLSATSENRTGEVRSATVTLTTSTLTQEVIIEQEAGRYIRLEEDTIRIGAQGGEIPIKFSTNMENGEFAAYYTDGWLTQGIRTRTETSYEVHLIAYPNLNMESRTAYILFTAAGEGPSGDPFASAVIVQEGLQPNEESTDYSSDKTVRILNEATRGTGIPIVLMGDGFMDTEIADGTYDAVMDQAYENLFAEEPMGSLRDYFDVYAITAVSRHSGIGTGHDTAFSSWLEGGNSTLIEGDQEAVMDYVASIEGIDYENTLAIVILNTHQYAGTTYFGYTDGEELTEFAIAYCPIVNSLDDEQFRTILCHEAIGHGFGKLNDEYAYEGTMPEKEIEEAKALQAIGWYRNVDFTNDPDSVLWSAFLSDSRYTQEDLGIYEGACTYAHGAYRPSEESLMNSNTLGFNAPSRQALYDKVMRLGEEREVTYEDFVSFDSPTAHSSRLRASGAAISRPLHAPQFVNQPLK